MNYIEKIIFLDRIILGFVLFVILLEKSIYVPAILMVYIILVSYSQLNKEGWDKKKC